MTNNEFVIKLIKYKEDHIRILNYHNIWQKDKIDDILQIVYIKCLNFKNINNYLINDEPNRYIMFMIIKNALLNYIKYEKKLNYTELSSNFEIEDIEYTEDILDYYKIKHDKLKNIISGCTNWYEQKIIDLYMGDFNSIRKIQKETGLSYVAIQPVVAKLRKIYFNIKT